MNFALVKVSRSPSRDLDNAYGSMILEIGATTKYTDPFDSEDEMIGTVHEILAKQKRHDDESHVLNKVKDGGYYFFDPDLSQEEADPLGREDETQH